MMTMTCGRARRLLWPGAGPREATTEIVEAREHLSRCDKCRGFLEDMRRMSEQIKAKAPRLTAPVEVRDRLFKTIAQARTDPEAPSLRIWRRRRLWQALAAGILVGGSWLGYQAYRGGSPVEADPVNSIVEDRLRSQSGPGLASADSLEVAQWLAERLPFAVQIPIFPEARLTGARLLVTSQQSGAVVEYAVQGRVLTYYILRSSGSGETSAPRDVRVVSKDGYHVASWVDAGLTHALAATLPGSKLVEYARYCIHQMMAAGVRLGPYVLALTESR
jgi:anti-sigma factor RsiW